MARGVVVPFPAQRPSAHVLTRVPGGLRQPATVTITADEYDRLRMSLAVRTAESLAFARRVGSHARAGLFATSRPQPDERMTEHHLSQIYRLAIQEQLRAEAETPDPEAARDVA